MMDRRTFLRRLVTGVAGAAIGAELDLERLLWVPKTIITVPAMPSYGDGMTFTSAEWLTREGLRLLKQNLVLANVVDRHVEDAFVGQTINVRVMDRRRVA